MITRSGIWLKNPIRDGKKNRSGSKGKAWEGGGGEELGRKGGKTHCKQIHQ